MAPTGTRVGFAGLGAMGFGMASNLLKNDVATVAFDLNPSLLERFIAIGGSVSKTVAEASKGQQVLLVMVATPGQVDNLVFSDECRPVSIEHTSSQIHMRSSEQVSGEGQSRHPPVGLPSFRGRGWSRSWYSKRESNRITLTV